MSATCEDGERWVVKVRRSSGGRSRIPGIGLEVLVVDVAIGGFVTFKVVDGRTSRTATVMFSLLMLVLAIL